MAWTNSKIFTAYIHDVLCNTSAADLDTDALIEAALFDNSITPSQTDTAAHNAYGAAGGSWASGGVSDASGWPALGRPLVWGSATRVTAATANPIVFDADDTVSANSSTTLTNAYGCLIYDHTAGTPTDEGFCFNYFGGANSVTAGTFTIVWNASGVFAITL